MKKILVLTASALVASSASAGDFYGALRGGYAFVQNDILQTMNTPMVATIADDKYDDTVGTYKMAVGYEKNGLAMEIEFSQFSEMTFDDGWLYQPDPTCTNTSCFMYNDFALNTDIKAVQANILYALDLDYKIKPVVGLGMGYAFVTEKGAINIGDWERTPSNDESAFVQSKAEKHTKFMWNIALGAEYSISEDLAINAMYRYSDIADIDNSINADMVKRDLNMHELISGMKYLF